jgi:hypothetical protein
MARAGGTQPRRRGAPWRPHPSPLVRALSGVAAAGRGARGARAGRRKGSARGGMRSRLRPPLRGAAAGAARPKPQGWRWRLQWGERNAGGHQTRAAARPGRRRAGRGCPARAPGGRRAARGCAGGRAGGRGRRIGLGAPVPLAGRLARPRRPGPAATPKRKSHKERGREGASVGPSILPPQPTARARALRRARARGGLIKSNTAPRAHTGAWRGRAAGSRAGGAASRPLPPSAQRQQAHAARGAPAAALRARRARRRAPGQTAI